MRRIGKGVGVGLLGMVVTGRLVEHITPYNMRDWQPDVAVLPGAGAVPLASPCWEEVHTPDHRVRAR
jgi:hypothetical protein